jgi:cysteine-rich repeat protein
VGISAGEVIFVLVGAFDDATEGGFTLSLRLRAAECGDGRVEPPEACDDGGQAPGDGCDALCQAEPGFFCSAAPAGQEGANAGDTSADGLPRSFRGSCVGSLTTPEAIFLFAAAQGGDLRAELDAESDHGLYARSACEGGEELGCADDVGAGGAPEVLVIRGLAAGEGAAIFVEAAAGAEPGPFTLALSLQ